MLYADVGRREERQREGKGQAHLLIVIDECAYTESIAPLFEALFALGSANRVPTMHLLFAAESLLSQETKAARWYQRIRDLAQYRICLRCGSVEESRAIIYRDEAAFLPASLPGRGYLLHGDQHLELFQSARLMPPAVQEVVRPKREPTTEKNVVVPAPMASMGKG